MLKIETFSVGQRSIVKVIGRLQSEKHSELAAQIDLHGAPAMLDLDEVTLVDVEVVRFLNQVNRRELNWRIVPRTFANG